MSTKYKGQFNKELIHQVDQQVMETGFYQAVELLLSLGLLPYADYEQWRMGNIPYLSDILSKKQELLIPLLKEANLYVKSLKMSSEPLLMQQWQQNNQVSHLKFCPEKSVFSEYLKTRYFRINDEQMDLFFDNRALTIINELKRALSSRNIQIASQKFQSLYELEPENELIVPAKNLLDSLINALEEDQIADTADEMQFLMKELAPLAKKILGGQDRDYMSLFWRRLARYTHDLNYTEQETENEHSSFCYEQIPDWQAVINSIEQTPNWTQYPQLFARDCTALRHSNQQEHYTQKICQYFWQFFDENTIQQNAPITTDFILEDPTLKSLWYDFHDLEFDNHWGMKNFPCLLLIMTPGISHFIIADKAAPEEFKLLHELIQTEINQQTQSIKLRMQLKQSNPEILKYYLKYH